MSDASDPPREVILVKPQQTDAMRNFETNISLLVAFLDRLKPNEIQRRSKSAMRVVGRYKADQTNIAPLERAITKLNEAELQQLSQSTNGVYIRLDDTDEAAAKIMAQLATIEQTATGDKSFTEYQSYFQWFLALALLFLLVETIIPERKMKLA